MSGLRPSKRAACRRRATVALAVAASSLAAAAGPASADPGDPVPTWVPDGPVRAVALDGDTAYLGGDFARLGPYTGASVLADPGTGQLRAGWPDVSGRVDAATPDGNGGWYLGGLFRAVGGVPRTNLAHVLPDGTVDPEWAPAADSLVRAITVKGSSVFLAGKFKNVAGKPRAGIAELSGPAGEPTSFHADLDGYANAVLVGGTPTDPIVYAGGRFTGVNGTTRSGVAAVRLSDSFVISFDANVPGEVTDLQLGPAGLYIAGEYTKVNGTTTRRGLSSVDPLSGAVSGWDPGLALPGVQVYDIEVSGGAVYAAGRIGTVNSNSTPVSRRGAAAFDATTAVATQWNPRLEGDRVVSLDVTADRVYIGGEFSRVNSPIPTQGPVRHNAAAVTRDTGEVLPWDPSPNGSVETITATDDGVVAGGLLTSAGGVTRHNLAAIDLTTGRPTDFDPNVDGAVFAVAHGPGGVWAGGDFTKVNGGTPRSHLANFDAATGAAGEFSQNLDKVVLALALDGSTVYAGGAFQTVNGATPRSYVAAFRDIPGTGGVLLPFDPVSNGPVQAILPRGDRVYLGGAFSAIGATPAPRANLAAVEPETGAPTPWNPSANLPVYGLTEHRGTIVASGAFSTVNGTVPRQGAAALGADDGAATDWDPKIAGYVVTASSDGERLYAGGAFAPAGSDPRNGLGLFDTSVNGLGTWQPNVATNVDAPTLSTAVSPGRWLVTGGYGSIPVGPVRTTRFAAFRLPAPATPPGGAGGPGGDGGNVPATNDPVVTGRDRIAPRITALRASRKKFRTGSLPKRGTTLSVTLTEPASVTYETLVVKTGRKTARGCVKASRTPAKGKRCKLFVRVASFAKKSPAGVSRVPYTGRTGKKRLKAGSYVLRATATDAAGNTGAARSLNVKVVK